MTDTTPIPVPDVVPSIEDVKAAYEEAIGYAHPADDWRPVELNDYATV